MRKKECNTCQCHLTRTQYQCDESRIVRLRPKITYALYQKQACRDMIQRRFRRRCSNITATPTTLIKNKTSTDSRNVQQHDVHNNKYDVPYYFERAYHESSRIYYSRSQFQHTVPRKKRSDRNVLVTTRINIQSIRC